MALPTLTPPSSLVDVAQKPSGWPKRQLVPQMAHGLPERL